MEFKSLVKHKILSAQSREIVHNVFKFMTLEAQRGELLVPLAKIQERVAQAVGISISTVKSIVKQSKNIDKGEASSFSTKHNKGKTPKKTKIDDIDTRILRGIVHNWYLQEKTAPTLKRLFRKVEEDTEFTGGRESLRKILHTIGFRWRKIKTNRSLLMERHDIRQLRTEFLKTIKQYREEGRPIIYMDETYIHSSHTHEKAWSDNSNEGLRKPVSKGQRLVIVHAGWEKGFIPNALLIFKSKSKSGDFHDDMNFTNYKKWVETKLIPNLPPRSVLVIDNAPYHNVQCEKSPTSASRKDEMKQWLRSRNITFADDMLKVELYNIVKMYKPRFKTYEVDKILEQHGHNTLRLPPYHPDLNPIELVWASLKQYVGSKNTTFMLSDVQKLCNEFFDNFSPLEWQSRCQHALKCEKEFLSLEPAIDIVIDQIIINLGDDDSDDDDDYDIVSSESENSDSE